MNETVERFRGGVEAYVRSLRLRLLTIDLPSSHYTVSMPPEMRFVISQVAFGSCAGFIVGGMLGARMASLRYTAERAHVKPTTRKGWFTYLRRKNYVASWGGIREGTKFAGKFACLLTPIVAGDVALDMMAEKVEWWHAAPAGSLTGFLFGLVQRLSRPALIRATVLSTLMSTLYSAAPHAVAFLSSTPFDYTTKYPPNEEEKKNKDE